MTTKQIGVFVEDEWVSYSYFPILEEIRKAGHKPVLITTNKEWDGGKRRSIPSGDEPIFRLDVDMSIHEVNIDDFVGFIFGGGYWADRLRWWFKAEKSPGILERPEPRSLVEKILRSEKHLVGTICHSMWILNSLKDVIGPKEVTCAYNIIDDVKNAGFTYVDKNVHVDGNLVSGRMSDNSRIFIKEFLKQLKGREKK